MTLPLDLTPAQEEHFTDTSNLPAEEGTAADLFTGRLGRIHSGGQGRWSEDTGTQFSAGMREKQQQGHL